MSYVEDINAIAEIDDLPGLPCQEIYEAARKHSFSLGALLNSGCAITMDGPDHVTLTFRHESHARRAGELGAYFWDILYEFVGDVSLTITHDENVQPWNGGK